MMQSKHRMDVVLVGQLEWSEFQPKELHVVQPTMHVTYT